ncbi:MAG: hypothetical protein LBH79_03050 [Nitrososphaerota archaeon]|nr:hypothetical protein [Nitrososphaerota archaeon]
MVEKLEPVEIYDASYADWVEIDERTGTNYAEQFIERYGTREEFAAKVAVKKQRDTYE